MTAILLVLSDREAGARAAHNTLPSPSVGISSFSDLQSVFTKHADVFHAGRPHGNYGPPVALYDPILGLLAFRLSHLDDDLPEIRPNRDELKWAHEFICRSLACYGKEEERRVAIQSSIESLDPNVGWKPTMGGITPDAVFGGKTGVPLGIKELKNEFGLGGDASTHARLAYTKIVTGSNNEIKMWRRKTNCPSVMWGGMGDLVEIGIAVYTDGSYSDYVFSSGRMRLDHHQNANVLRIARAFKAVKLALSDLRRFYERLESTPPGVKHLFPSPLAEPSWTGRMPRVTFTHRMSRSGELFITATTEDERRSNIYVGTMSLSSGDEAEVVVKFTAEYNADAHHILARAGLAPTLHACVPVCGGMLMVVMDRVHGKMAWVAEQSSELLPHTVYEDVKAAIDLLHHNGVVFGDLRTPNVMVLDRTSGDPPRMGAMLVDFDWAGKADEKRYPAVLNDGLDIWPPGADRGAIMRKEHDLYMLEQFKSLCHSA
ncbi:hypothetical protein C8Q76DRAFT_715689 [Earliella scabrosa]|nr:hypothetical protein C8Q76DRAFT_715689 [Earliella scabrosa]